MGLWTIISILQWKIRYPRKEALRGMATIQRNQVRLAIGTVWLGVMG